MMGMDLLDILMDPDMGGTAFVYERVTETVSAKGRAETSSALVSADGNIQPAPGRERELLPEGDRAKESILIFTPAELSAGGGSIQADLVHYRDGKYRVATAEAWREHAGFTKAVAVLEVQP